MWELLHHDAESSGFDWVTGLIVVGVLVGVAGLGYLLWRAVQKRRYGE